MKTKYERCWVMAWLLAVNIGLLTAGSTARAAALYYWYNIGPQPINTLDTNKIVVEQDSGRVTSLAVDPSNSDHWLIGAAQGGVWETFDAGANWDPRTDSQASMAMGAIAFAPGSPSRVYAGTGEANFRGDAYAGAGLLLSLNGGTSWQMLNTNFAKTAFSRIRVNSLNASNLVAATARGGGGVGEESSGHGNVPGAPPRGVFVSTNGGFDFIQVLTGEATALEANPSNFNQQYAGLGEIYGDPANGVYRTTNGWQTSQLIMGPWAATTNFVYTNIPIATNVSCSNSVCYTNITYTNILTGTNVITNAFGRIAMAISPAYPNVLYVGVAEPRVDYKADLSGIWLTTNAWADIPGWTQLDFPDVEHDYDALPRFWYMFDLLVDPADPAVLYLAEFEVWRFDSGGWNSIADWGKHVHPDNHVMAWVPGAGPTYQMLLGNDGGVFLSDTGVSGSSWTSLNGGLRITQFYKGAVDPTGVNVLAIGGAQDEFTSLYTGSTAWIRLTGGDGGDCAISSADPLNDWATSADSIYDKKTDTYLTGIQRTRIGGLFSKDYDSVTKDIKDVLPMPTQFYVHFEKAPYNDNLFVAGTARLWRCNNFFTAVPTWSANSPTMLDTNGAPIPISAMAFAPSGAGGLAYAYGTEDGQLRVTRNGGGGAGNWSDPDPAHVLPNHYVSGLAFSPVDTNVLYVAFSGFDGASPGHAGHLFKTTNVFAATPTWTNVSPPGDVPNNCVAIDPNDSGNVYVGTDVGIWNSFNGGSSWFHHGPASGLPNVAVYDLRFNSGSGLTAFTHGRGAYLFSRFEIPILVYVPPDFHPTPNCLTCPPDEPWLNPGDLVSVEIVLQNILPFDTVDLKATMLPSADIRPFSGTQTYGVVKGQGKGVGRVFKFIAGGGAGPIPSGKGASSGCGGTVQAVLLLQDRGTNIGQISIPFRLGAPSHPLVEDFEQPPQGLPPGWTSTASGAGTPWMTTTNEPPNLPVSGEDESAPPSSPNSSAFVSDAPGVGQSFLTSPPFPVATSQARLYFREAFIVSNTFDGLILEISIGGQGFQEIVQAGGLFVKDGYNTVLSDFNPLGPRPAWSGDSGGWLPVSVNLPATAAGQAVQLRWHFAGSRGLPGGVWLVDSVQVTEPICLPPVSNPVILNPALRGNVFTFAINTVSNRSYVIEYRTNLTDAGWQTLQILSGNGNQQIISVPTAPDRQRFYRFRVE